MKRLELLDDEKIILVNPKHWRNYIVPCFILLLCFAAIVVKLKYPTLNIINIISPGLISEANITSLSYLEVSIMVLLIAAVYLSMITTAHTYYYVTNQRIVVVEGWINVRMSDMLLERCETISLSQRFWEGIFNSGDLLCISAGTQLYLDDVYDARHFRQVVINEMARIEDEQ